MYFHCISDRSRKIHALEPRMTYQKYGGLRRPDMMQNDGWYDENYYYEQRDPTQLNPVPDPQSYPHHQPFTTLSNMKRPIPVLTNKQLQQVVSLLN